MGPLFSMPLLLVEGDDDYRIWSQVPRHHVISLSVIPANGEEIFEHQKRLEQLFAALREPADVAVGFALLDGDKATPIESNQAPQAYIRYIRLACHESENLYLSDEVLAAIGLDWQRAQEMITKEAVNFGRKSERLSLVAKGDRKTCDLKNLMEELTQILDLKKVMWTIRVAQTIGKARPVGQVADFLGRQVVEALWGKVPVANIQ